MRPEVNKVRLTILIALLFSALCAGVFRTTPIVFMAALLCSAPLVGIIVGTIGSRGLSLTRNLPECGMAGDVIHGEITLQNTARYPAFLIHVYPSYGVALRVYNQSEDPPPAILPVGEDEQVLSVLRPDEKITWRQQWLLLQRGVHTLPAARAGTFDPLGLYMRLPARSEKHKIIVLPRPIHIEKLGFLGGAGNASLAPHHATTVADATDYHGVRPWQQGEAIRRVHWKSTARTNQLHVVEWEETPNSDLILILDTDARTVLGQEDESTLEQSVTAAASVAVHLLENGCRVHIYFFAADSTKTGTTPVLRHCQGKNIRDTHKILRMLAEIKPVEHPEANLEKLVQSVSPSLPRGMELLLLASRQATIAAAAKQLRAASPGSRCHALAFDCELPQTNFTPTGAEETHSAESADKPSRPHSTKRYSSERRQSIQIISGKDALAAALESRA